MSEASRIIRIWHGYTTAERADDYEALLKAEIIRGIEDKNIPGFRKIDVLRRPASDEVEFVTVMEFDNLESVKAFVGEDYETAYVPGEGRAILSRFDARAQHYEIRDSRSYVETAVEPVVVAEPALPEPQELPMAALAEHLVAPAAAPSGQPLLAPNVWFVRSNKGNGSFPVTREGFCVIRNFIIGMLLFAAIAAVISIYGAWQGPSWLVPAGPIVFGVGALLAALYFINTARKHTDYALTHNDYVKARHHA